MWYTTRQEGFDDPRHTKRGPCINVNAMLGFQLRMGFTLELVSLTGLYICYWVYGGFGLFGYDLGGTTEGGRSNQTFRTLLAIFTGINLLGAIGILAFQSLMADDACWPRGLRAGSKILRLASYLDVLSSLLQFMFYLFLAKFYQPKWWMHFNDGGSEWTFFAFTRILHGVSFIFYGQATYLLEVYHDEGAGDLHAYLNAVFFGISGCSEILVVFFKYGSVSTALIWLALALATVWAYFFEPEVNDVSPALHETELTNDVEQQVEKFARMSPYYPGAAVGYPTTPDEGRNESQ